MSTQDMKVIWKMSAMAWAVLLLAAGLLTAVTWVGLQQMVHFWGVREEYSHGYLIPFITVFLIWQKKSQLEAVEFQGSWLGLLVVILAMLVAALGLVSATHVFVQYGFFLGVIGIALSFMGWQGIKPVIVPLLFLGFMIPLPGIFLFRLSSELQLISSQLGVAVIRWFDISVHLEGNVIDLGVFKLQVVEACSGLRYLFPMMSLAFIAAYFFRAPFWQRVVVFLSSIPVTILMNSFRIGMIGVLVEYWGIEQAEGFLHYFEGWVVFMASLGLLLIEMWLFSRIGQHGRPFREVFGLELPEPSPTDAAVRLRVPGPAVIAAIVVLALSSAGMAALGQRERPDLARKDFSVFPVRIGGWHGRPDRLEQIYLDKLKLDDYIIADYRQGSGDSVNLYIAYYVSQGAGGAAHSPKTCLPGGGWVIRDISEQTIDVPALAAESLRVNRVLIKKGEYTQLVYYWFQQRGRDITSEYMVKWYLFVDALKKNRTDGALVRLTTMVQPGESVDAADARLQEFARELTPILSDYIPG